jgi:hypothetical protein
MTNEPGTSLWSTYRPLHLAAAALLCLIGLTAGCSEDPVEPVDKLCRTGAGLGARILGTPDPVDMCVPNDQTTTLFGDVVPGRYELSAVFTVDSITIEINVTFQSRTDLPKVLVFTIDPNLPGPDDVWFFYRETKPGVYDYTSASVAGGFTLTFSDPTVAVATFNSLQIDLEDAGGTPTGTRVISEGFLSVTPDN